MLRIPWNATGFQGRAYVHVASTSEDAEYTMVLILPPVYTWSPAEPQAPLSGRDSGTQFQGLGLDQNYSVIVDLNFTFPFFGLECRRVWVTAFGMVLFEDPTSKLDDGFHGVGDIHAAVTAAAASTPLAAVL